MVKHTFSTDSHLNKTQSLHFPPDHPFIISPLSTFVPFFLSCSLSRLQNDCCLGGDGEDHEGDVATGTWKCNQLPCYLQTQVRRAPAGSQGGRWQHLHCAETSYSPHHLRHHCSASLPFRRRQSKARRRNYTYVGLSFTTPQMLLFLLPSLGKV